MCVFKKISIFIFAIMCSSFFLNCSKSDSVTNLKSNKLDNQTDSVKLRKLNETKSNIFDGKNIILILGWGFNDEKTISDVKQTFASTFGIESENQEGLISLFVYPNDFISGNKEKINLLEKFIENKDILGMIIFGAPDKTHKVLSSLKDKAENRTLSYPVFSFFPQDDIMGSQYVSDFVLDYSGNSNASSSVSLENEKTFSIPNFNTTTVITNAVQTIIINKTPLKSDENLINTVQKIIGSNHKVSNYVDKETGLTSINHFTFE